MLAWRFSWVEAGLITILTMTCDLYSLAALQYLWWHEPFFEVEVSGDGSYSAFDFHILYCG